MRRRIWTLLPAGLFGLSLVSVGGAIRETCGRWAYPVDDAYIHMGIARNIVQHGVWGIDGTGFASTSSSPVWTVLLALAGAREETGLALAFLSAIFLGWATHRMVGPGRAEWVTAAALTLQVWLVPLGWLTALGMEHVLQAALLILVLGLGARVLDGERPDGERPDGAAVDGMGTDRGLLIAVGASALVCYEAIFVVVCIALALVATRRVLAGARVAFAGVGPLGLYAAVSVGLGWYPVPNPIMLKTSLASQDPWHAALAVAIETIRTRTDLVILVGAAAVVGALAAGRRDRWQCTLFAGTGLLHLALARTGSFGRYDAYLVAAGVAVLVGPLVGLARGLPTRGRVGLLLGVVLLSLPLIERARDNRSQLGDSARVVCHDQLPMARFLAEAYGGRTVAVAEIGAVSWLGDARIIDLLGLGDIDVARRIRSGTYDVHAVAELTQSADVVVAYDHWMRVPGFGGPPAEWTHVGDLVDPDLVRTSPDALLRFYAPRPSEIEPLRQALGRFPAVAPTYMRLHDDLRVEVDDLVVLEGTVGTDPAGTLSFYSNGRAEAVAPAEGELWLRAYGTPGEGRQPRLAVACAEGSVELDVPSGSTDLSVCRVRSGERVAISYVDDWADGTDDRNVFVQALTVRVGQ